MSRTHTCLGEAFPFLCSIFLSLYSERNGKDMKGIRNGLSPSSFLLFSMALPSLFLLNSCCSTNRHVASTDVSQAQTTSRFRRLKGREASFEQDGKQAIFMKLFQSFRIWTEAWRGQSSISIRTNTSLCSRFATLKALRPQICVSPLRFSYQNSICRHA